MPATVHVQQQKAVFFKPSVIDNASLEEGQCSKESNKHDEEVGMAVDEELVKETEAAANKAKKDKDIWCSI